MIVAGAFPPVVTATVVWLTEMGLDITLQRVQAYRVFDNQTVVTVSQLFPVPDVEEFTVSPQRAEARSVEQRRQQGREKSTVIRLVTAGTIPDGTQLRLRPTTEVTAEVRAAVDEWVAEQPERGIAIWHNDRRRPLQWQADGERYRPTEIVRQVLAEAAAIERSVRGPRGGSWTMAETCRRLQACRTAAPSIGASLHTLLAALPAGRWTTYGDLARVIETAAQPLGQHLTHVHGLHERPPRHRR